MVGHSKWMTLSDTHSDCCDKPPVLIIAGPTASGKSDLALCLAEQFDGEIINADSMQVYRELSILTGRPSSEVVARVPHHLYGIQSVAHASSAGAWLRAAENVIELVRGRNKLPIVCGGTGLYLKVLCEGIAPVPSIPDSAIIAAGKLYDEEGGAAFLERLHRIDPIAAERLPSADRQRLIRSYVVRLNTGRTLDAWRSLEPIYLPIAGSIITIYVAPPRGDLYRRIDRRLIAMIEAGALDEVASLDRSLASNLPALKALGVREFQCHLDGHCSLSEVINTVQQATRNFAKRQITWFRKHLTADFRVDNFGDQLDDPMVQKIFSTFSYCKNKSLSKDTIIVP